MIQKLTPEFLTGLKFIGVLYLYYLQNMFGIDRNRIYIYNMYMYTLIYIYTYVQTLISLTTSVKAMSEVSPALAWALDLDEKTG